MDLLILYWEETENNKVELTSNEIAYIVNKHVTNHDQFWGTETSSQNIAYFCN